MIAILGDTHGDIDIAKVKDAYEHFDKKSKDKTDYLIICGDFGFFFHQKDSYSAVKMEEKLTKIYSRKNTIVLFIDGNHENFNRLFSDEFPEVEMFGASVKKIRENIFYLKRGRVYNIEGKTFFTMGGGYSIDKANRTEHISWWKEEMPSYVEMKKGFASLKAVGSEVDYILTHTCSASIFQKMVENPMLNLYHKGVNEEKILRDFLQVIEETVDFKKWFFGHFHYDYKIDEKHVSLYDKVEYLEV